MQFTSAIAISILGFSAAIEAQRLSGYSYLDRRDYNHALARRGFHLPSFGKVHPTEPKPVPKPSDPTSAPPTIPPAEPNPGSSQPSSPPVGSPAGSPAGTPPHSTSGTPGTSGNPGTPAAPGTPPAAPGAPGSPTPPSTPSSPSVSGKVQQLAQSALQKLQSGNMKVTASVASKLIGVACELNSLTPLIDSDSTALQDLSTGITIGCTAQGIIGVLAGSKRRRAVAPEPWRLRVRDAEPAAWAYADPEPKAYAEPEWSDEDVMLFARWLYGNGYEW